MMYFHKDSKLFCILELRQIRLSWNLLLLLKPGPMRWLFGRLVPSREDESKATSFFLFEHLKAQIMIINREDRVQLWYPFPRDSSYFIRGRRALYSSKGSLKTILSLMERIRDLSRGEPTYSNAAGYSTVSCPISESQIGVNCLNDRANSVEQDP